ncbi:hypothetical protein DPSP01_000128 [Paraphaeosphaeria sporulosa]|uniref:Zinc finger PHD-type domain-containing protein n=1 Tax=Paraphaeosphaeria sporulosa TaxID=1460663 RepID=A0A177CZK7_9PLEO|nr:uncharacterized protein CC84DRAFT_1077982 [Paraphaeosphaeria sporulosa]OAG12944.1 hypothetical protein CC84DRAFT_1077982 [Paraphaeosphaeria sporulosa]
MVARKRGRDEMETEAPVEEPTTLQKLRNMWQFANLAQYIFLFKGALKIDEDFGIEELETECLTPQPSQMLAAIGLALLKHVSSHKGLTPEIFDEYTRRQFVAKAPARNPFGTEEVPNRFDDFDVFTKIRVLQQLSVWTLNNPNTIRERLNPTEAEQIDWRFNPFGYDSKGRTIFVLDDMRMYRRTDAPPPPPPQKAKSKAKARKSRSSRTSKRRKTSTPEPEEPEEVDEVTEGNDAEAEDDGFGGMQWECVCITYEDYQDYLTGIRKSRHPDEKQLYKDLEADIIPELAKVAEAQARKEAKKMRELETLQKLATAKRSSRISAKMDRQREIEEAEEAARKRQEEIAMAKAEQEKQRHMEDAHESRRQTREQRIREREAQKILQEENLRKLEEDEKKLASEEARLSERHLTAQMKKAKRDLERLKEKEYWLFDCEKCGLNGECIDDGKPQIQCDEKDGCGVWQHSACHGISAKRAEAEDFKFLCASCTRKQQAAKEPKLALKLRLTSASPNAQRTLQTNGTVPKEPSQQLNAVEVPPQPFPQSPERPFNPGHSLMNGPSLSPRGQALGPPGIQRSEAAYGSPLIPAGSSSPTRPRQPSVHGGANGFPGSSPPRLPPHAISSFNNGTPGSRQNGSPFNTTNPFQSNFHPTYNSSFSRPTSAAGTTSFGSPVKHSSPRPVNGVPNGYNFTNSPYSSFPPSNVQASAMSPIKHSSPPPPLPQMSSPAPAPVSFIAPSPSQMPAQILPDPIPAPLKHDGARPPSSHEVSETHVFPPLKALSPIVPPQNLSPPTKKSSPAPLRTYDASTNGNPFDSSN